MNNAKQDTHSYSLEKSSMTDLNTAIALALQVHRHQVDKAGQPYILHPLRLMMRFQDDPARIAAVLHDVVEDGDIRLEDLRSAGFSPEIIDAIDGLSRRPGESYEAFIDRLSGNDLARRVKIEDLKDNLDVTRLSTLSPKDIERLAKYHRALQRLLSA